MKQVFKLLVVQSLILLAVPAYADDIAENKLKKMNDVARTLNYQGVFSYQSNNNQLQSIKIIHRSNEQGEVEKLVSLNGVEREVIRVNDRMTCIYPEGKAVQENRRPLGRGFPTDLLRRLNAASNYYEISLGKEERIAAHHTQELIMSPIDDYRYGYNLWVDKQNDLLLQANLVNTQGNVLETFAFSSVAMNVEISDVSLDVEMKGNQVTWNRKEQSEHRNAKNVSTASPWQVQWVPEGFALISQKNRFNLKNGAAVEQRVYSDGLNSVSIFFEKIRSQHGHLSGGSTMGLVNAFGTVINANFVTIVGEVPAITTEKIAASISYEQRDQ